MPCKYSSVLKGSPGHKPFWGVPCITFTVAAATRFTGQRRMFYKTTSGVAGLTGHKTAGCVRKFTVTVQNSVFMAIFLHKTLNPNYFSLFRPQRAFLKET